MPFSRIRWNDDNIFLQLAYLIDSDNAFVGQFIHDGYVRMYALKRFFTMLASHARPFAGAGTYRGHSKRISHAA